MKKLIVTILLLLLPAVSSADLTFGNTLSDNVNHGSAANLDNLTTLTWINCARVTTITSGRHLIAKSNAQTNGKLLRLSGTTGNIEFRDNRATTNTDYITSDTPLVANKLIWNATTYNSSTVPMVHIFHANLNAPSSTIVESSYGTNTDGVGAESSDAARNLFVGNNESAAGVAFQGSIGCVHILNRALNFGELQDQFSHPHVVSGTILFAYYGGSPTATQPDWSGFGNMGTPSGTSAFPMPNIRRYGRR